MKRLYVIKDKCNGCMSCVVACQKSHANSEAYASIRDSEPARLYIQTVDKMPVPLVCHHCDDPACVKACMSGAMQKDEITGIVSNEGHEQHCVGCWMCVMVCPYGVINAKNDGDQKVAVKCDLCSSRGYPACVDACPSGAIVYVDEAELKSSERGGIYL